MIYGDIIPNAPAAVTERLAAYQQDAAGAFSENTQRALRSDTRVFADWCARNGYDSLPASAPAVRAFLQDHAGDGGKAPATLRRYLASIAHLHRAAGLPDPTKSNEVRLGMKAIARHHGNGQQQAHGLTLGVVDRLLDATPDSLRGRRDAALLAVAYSTLARRSELVALDVADVTFSDDGSATVLIRRSKTDPTAEGSVRYLAPKATRLLGDWLMISGVSSGPLFRSTPRGRDIGEALSGNDVARAFKRLAEAAGLPPEYLLRISGQSTRVGAAQDLVSVGNDLAQVMRDGGWKNAEMVARYTRHQAVKHGGMAKLAAAKGWH